MKECVQIHTSAAEGKDGWVGVSAEQGQKQESRQGGFLLASGKATEAVLAERKLWLSHG